MKCIIGLGNPGKKYAQTRHNIGFIVVDEMLKRNQEKLSKNKFKCDYELSRLHGEKVLYVQPQTFMNLSGEGIRPLLDFYKISVENIIVIYDDLDLPVGKIRLRTKGGHGGHNGIRSLIDHLGTKEFKRIRVGVGRPTTPQAIVDYVLQPFAKSEVDDVHHAIMMAADATEKWVETSFNDAMNQFNQK
ncbi:MAG TPA: aminoacyl-tRNA hydrolase [Pseudogracilibacillus sp.]|nr:aminoacyl-tRNA hydrolase [Pseudogracilibacillus sp.]